MVPGEYSHKVKNGLLFGNKQHDINKNIRLRADVFFMIYSQNPYQIPGEMTGTIRQKYPEGVTQL
jgi:hypothetical protein